MFKTILLPVDFQESGFTDRALAVALGLAREHGSHLHVLTVMPGVGSPWVSTYLPRDATRKARAALEEKLAAWVAERIPQAVPTSTRVAEGAPHRRILEEAERVNADLIVLASHDESPLDRVLLGSVSARVVERSHVSVMVVRQPGQTNR